MKIQQYLSRIGFYGEAKPDRETLEELLRCHLEQVPFENLECYQNPHPMSLKIEDLYEKVVLHRRGGICFELNGLFLWLLESLGFDVYPILVRIQMGSDKLEPISHQAMIVTLDGEKYYCDVGFGGPAPKGLIALDKRQIQTVAGEEYRSVLRGCQYEIQWYHRNNWETLFSFVDLPAAQEDFEILMFYFSACPDSEFVQCRLLNLCLPDGSLALTDHQFTKREGEHVTRFMLNTREESEEVIRKEFHIDLPIGLCK